MTGTKVVLISSSNRSKMVLAAEIIIAAQTDFNRILSDGERRDLLKDNTDWPSDEIHAIVAEITERTR